MKEILYYTTQTGKCPFQEWLNKLDSIEQKKSTKINKGSIRKLW
jgi:hypothetical protein